jgi:hypothetical protein
MLSGIALPYCYTFEAFTAVRFVMGLSFNTFWSSMYVLSVEYGICLCGQEKHHGQSRFGAWIHSGWSSGSLVTQSHWRLETLPQGTVSSSGYYQMRLCRIWSRKAKNFSALFYVVKSVTKSHDC